LDRRWKWKRSNDRVVKVHRLSGQLHNPCRTVPPGKCHCRGRTETRVAEAPDPAADGEHEPPHGRLGQRGRVRCAAVVCDPAPDVVLPVSWREATQYAQLR